MLVHRNPPRPTTDLHALQRYAKEFVCQATSARWGSRAQCRSNEHSLRSACVPDSARDSTSQRNLMFMHPARQHPQPQHLSQCGVSFSRVLQLLTASFSVSIPRGSSWVRETGSCSCCGCQQCYYWRTASLMSQSASGASVQCHPHALNPIHPLLPLHRRSAHVAQPADPLAGPADLRHPSLLLPPTQARLPADQLQQARLHGPLPLAYAGAAVSVRHPQNGCNLNNNGGLTSFTAMAGFALRLAKKFCT